jgi:hypothetical protein
VAVQGRYGLESFVKNTILMVPASGPVPVAAIGVFGITVYQISGARNITPTEGASGPVLVAARTKFGIKGQTMDFV